MPIRFSRPDPKDRQPLNLMQQGQLQWKHLNNILEKLIRFYHFQKTINKNTIQYTAAQYGVFFMEAKTESLA